MTTCERCGAERFDEDGSGEQAGTCMAHIDQAPPEEAIDCRDRELAHLKAQLAAAQAELRDRVAERDALVRVLARQTLELIQLPAIAPLLADIRDAAADLLPAAEVKP